MQAQLKGEKQSTAVAQVAGKQHQHFCWDSCLPENDFCWPVCCAYVYKGMTGQTGMGPAMFFRLDTLADMQWCLHMMTALAEAEDYQRKKDKVLLVAVDASEYAYATYTPDGGFQ